MGWFDKLTGRGDAHIELVKMPLVGSFVQPVEPDDGIHHEYFVNDEALDGRYQWLCRVYGKDGAVHGDSGATETPEQAASAAQSWAAAKKRELRGIA